MQDLTDSQLLRYSRQLMLPQFDVRGQQRLLDSTVLIVGLGGLGSATSMYLAAAGVGHLVLCDFDKVELTNLQRQIVHFTQDIGSSKVQSAREKLLALNPEVRITPIEEKLDYSGMSAWIKEVDLVIDGSDNFTTRFLVNRVCVENGRALVSGAAIRMEGQVSVFLNDGAGPCYRCLYRDEGDELLERCSETGILSPVVGIIGSIQACEAVKVLAGIGDPLVGRVLLLDALSMEWRSLRLKKDPRCPVCNNKNNPTPPI